MLLCVGGAHHRHAGDELGVADLVPLSGQVQHDAQAAVLHLGGRHIGLGQHGDGVLLRGSHLGSHLRRLAVIFDLHILVGVDAVLPEQIAQHVLRGSPLAGGQDGAALQVCKAVDGVALFHHIQHAQRVHGHDLDAAAGLLVKGCGEVGRDGGDVHFALNELGHDLIGGTVELQVVGLGSRSVLFHGQQIHQTHGGGAFQAGHPDGGVRLGRCPAGQHPDEKHRRQQQGCQFFHHCVVPSSLDLFQS